VAAPVVAGKRDRQGVLFALLGDRVRELGLVLLGIREPIL
jgi:hypothetical protein